MKARTAARAAVPSESDDRKRILIVDDHPIVCEGLRKQINGESDLMVCGEAPTAQSAWDAIATTKPDLVIVDISLEGACGLDLIKDLRIRYASLPVVVLSMHPESLYAQRALHAGAKAYVMKLEKPAVLLEAIRKVLRGQVHLSEKVTQTIINRIGGNVVPQDSPSPLHQLSDRELVIFQLIGDGFGTHEIADRLHLSVKTVASHREHIKQKLDLKSGDELMRFAIHWARHDTPPKPDETPTKPPSSSREKREHAARARA